MTLIADGARGGGAGASPGGGAGAAGGAGVTSASLIDPSLQRDLLLNQQRLDALNPFADDM